MTRAAASVNYRAVLFHQAVMVAMRLFIYRKLVEIIIIDGLRQDVLYSADEASYTDPSGCGKDTSCNIEVNETNLPGLSRIMGADSTIKLKNVTSVFPSITLASWASVFTGKMPGETGILGNEFFARDLSVSTPDLPGISVPRELNNPPGIISLSSGAFEGYDEFGLLNGLLTSKFFVPYQPDWKDPPIDNIEKTPQNDRRVLLQDTVYESIAGISGHSDTGMEGVKQYFAARGGDPVVVANNHYARGAYWLTWDIEIGSGVSQILDKASWDKLDDYLQGKYMESGERNGVPFSALTVWYLPGLDHEAHGKGMGVYRDYFMNTTDNYINKVMETLKNMGEFDNKIFIVVADHGHTAMPIFDEMILTIGNKDVKFTPYTKCELNVKGFEDEEIQYSEKYNNNLHIWELGDYLKTVGEFVEQATTYVIENKVLASKEIAKLFIDTATGQSLKNGAAEKKEDANIIAALNGPMVHIYVKGSDWSTIPDIDRILEVAEIFRVTLQGAQGGDSPLPIFPIGSAERFGYKIGRLANSIDAILVRDGGQYKIYGVDNRSGTPVAALKDLNSLSSQYVDAINRIEKMNNGERSGDIVLIMKDNVDIPQGESIENHRYTTGVSCKSWHGSLNSSDSYVPFIFTYPGGNKIEIENILKKDDACSNDFAACKGNWKLTDAVRGIIQEQYQ